MEITKLVKNSKKKSVNTLLQNNDIHFNLIIMLFHYENLPMLILSAVEIEDFTGKI